MGMTAPQHYDHKTRESHWQKQWEEKPLPDGYTVYAWQGNQSRENTYVIDTPPPTVSGHLHMGHIFSYTHADFIARYQRMKGKDVFYPMGFDDNGLPTERLVEKTKKVRATDMSREAFIALCEEVSAEARGEFRALFTSTALSVDWRQEYHTISEHARRVSQASFIDLYNKGQVYRKLQPMLWDPVDQTAIAQAEVEDKEMSGVFCDIYFEVTNADGTPLDEAEFGDRKLKADSDQNAIIWREGRSYIVIGTTRPEMIPACVGIFYHPNDTRYQGLQDKEVLTPLFGVRVPILTDDTVEPDKGTGIMMCCTFGDEADIMKWEKIEKPEGVKEPIEIIDTVGRISFFTTIQGIPEKARLHSNIVLESKEKMKETFSKVLDLWCSEDFNNTFRDSFSKSPYSGIGAYCAANYGRDSFATKSLEALVGEKVSKAREIIIDLLKENNFLVAVCNILHTVKCAERSGAPLEILNTRQWFINVLEHKVALKEKSQQCDWKPEWMAKRIEQWIDGLKWDWCISRQRYYGVPFPLWYFSKKTSPDSFGVPSIPFLAELKHLPVNPLTQRIPHGFTESYGDDQQINKHRFATADKDFIVYDFLQNQEIHIAKGEEVLFSPDPDVMDTTSSLTPQISAWGFGCHPERSEGSHAIDGDSSAMPQNDSGERFHKLFPADLRPQAHEIIRTWAFYTLAKAHLHHDSIPWKHLMISGWCLASDKTKMSKSKGNVVTPAGLLETHSADAVRYWASTSKLGSDTAFSEDVLKIGRKLVNKLWNASKFVLGMMESYPHSNLLPEITSLATQEACEKPAPVQLGLGEGNISNTLDRWMLSRIHHAITESDKCFAEYDYTGARSAIESVFWNDFCDNYLELVKSRAYGNMGEAGRTSAIATLSASLNALLKLFAPFVPHITEELYHLVYSEEAKIHGSIHARGSFPDATAYPHDAAAETAGEAAVAVLELIRKAKSERGVSIKYPIDVAYLTGADASVLEGVIEDVKAAGTVAELYFSVAPTSAHAVLQDEVRGYVLAVNFASEANVV
jgi:valyl-tRNA synthetase